MHKVLICSACTFALLLAGCSSESTGASPAVSQPPQSSAPPSPSPSPSPPAAEAAPGSAAAATPPPSEPAIDLCDALLSIQGDLIVVAAAPIDGQTAQDAYDGATAARSKVKELAAATRWMEESTTVSVEEAFLPSGLRRLQMRLGLYRRDLVRLTDDGSLSRVDRLELQADGENIMDAVTSETDWAC